MADGATPSTWKIVKTGPRWSETVDFDFEPIFARNASALTPSEISSLNTNMKSTTRFPIWSLYVTPKPPKGARKRKTADFRVQHRTSLEKSRLQSFFVWKNVRTNCKAFIGRTVRAEMIGRDDHFYVKFWVKLTALETNRRFSIYFRRPWRISRNTWQKSSMH